MNTRFMFALSASLLFAGNTLAADSAALMKKNNCVTCHQTDKKTIGPALKDIAKKYKGDKRASSTLAKKVRSGGSGNWGTVAMVPTPATVSDADIKVMVAAILATK